eukprot:m.143567 g.143567  ORF g.143567 m.143567 type:complete len:71 (+) comp22991_c0_seq1:101-313(+)
MHTLHHTTKNPAWTNCVQSVLGRWRLQSGVDVLKWAGCVLVADSSLHSTAPNTIDDHGLGLLLLFAFLFL